MQGNVRRSADYCGAGAYKCACGGVRYRASRGRLQQNVIKPAFDFLVLSEPRLRD